MTALVTIILFLFWQRTSANIKIFTDPMPGSNERSIQLIGSIEQVAECAQHFLDDIGKVSAAFCPQAKQSCEI